MISSNFPLQIWFSISLIIAIDALKMIFQPLIKNRSQICNKIGILLCKLLENNVRNQGLLKKPEETPSIQIEHAQ